MSLNILFITDPLIEFNIIKDTTYAMMVSADQAGCNIFQSQLNNLSAINGVPYAGNHKIRLQTSQNMWFKTESFSENKLDDFDAIIMRKEPPFDMEYIYATYILELTSSWVINSPLALRNFNEKMVINQFPHLIPNTLISRQYTQIKNFLSEKKDIIVKPLDGMGGSSIFRIKEGDLNTNVILEMLTNYQQNYVMVQTYIPEIKNGDKRILIVNGKPIDYIAARIPDKNDNRGNTAAGATVEVRKISSNEKNLASEIGIFLMKNSIYFAGIDVIGNMITEINITCPTMAQHIFRESGVNATDIFIENIIQKLKSK